MKQIKELIYKILQKRSKPLDRKRYEYENARESYFNSHRQCHYSVIELELFDER